MENVIFGKTTVTKNMIWQDISWSTVQLQSDVTYYLIKYDTSPKMALRTIASNTTSDILKLNMPTSNTTFTVWVAAIRNRALRDQGDFSDPQSITYTSMFSEHDLRSMTLTLSVTLTNLSFITAPGPPQDLTFVNRTCHSITFQWSPPDDTGRLDVTGYDILHNGTPVATITGTVYTLEGLTPDTVHTISVRTRNAIGPSVLERTLTAATGGRGTYFCCTDIIIALYCVQNYPISAE